MLSTIRFRVPIGFAVALLGVGCKTVGPDYVGPPTTAPPRFEMAGEPISALVRSEADVVGARWWESLGSDKLDQMIANAIKASPTVAEADAALEAALAVADSVYGHRDPRGQANAGVERARINPASFGFDGIPAATLSRYTVGASVSYDLDLFGGQRRARESVDAQVQVQQFRLEAARLTLAGNIAMRAVEIASLRAELAAAEAAVDNDQQTLILVEQAIAAGAAPRTDLVRVQTQLAQDEAELPALRFRVALARHALATLSGTMPAEWTLPDLDLADFQLAAPVPVVIPSLLLRGRPDIRAAESALRAAVAQIGVAKAQLYPSVDLTATFTQTALGPNDIFGSDATGWKVGSSVMAPLLQRRTLRANVRRVVAEAKAADARFRMTVLRAFGEVADALLEVATSDQEWKAQQRTLQLAQESLSLSRRAYEFGRARAFDVLDAQRQTNSLRRAMSAAEGRRLAAIVALQAATATAESFRGN